MARRHRISSPRQVIEAYSRAVAARSRETGLVTARIAAASLRQVEPLRGQGGPDKQETPGLPGPEASTDRETLVEVPGGCSAQCAR
jgi:hypothetical protein